MPTRYLEDLHARVLLEGFTRPKICTRCSHKDLCKILPWDRHTRSSKIPLRAHCEDLARCRRIGGPPTKFMRDIYTYLKWASRNKESDPRRTRWRFARAISRCAPRQYYIERNSSQKVTRGLHKRYHYEHRATTRAIQYVQSDEKGREDCALREKYRYKYGTAVFYYHNFDYFWNIGNNI